MKLREDERIARPKKWGSVCGNCILNGDKASLQHVCLRVKYDPA